MRKPALLLLFLLLLMGCTLPLARRPGRVISMDLRRTVVYRPGTLGPEIRVGIAEKRAFVIEATGPFELWVGDRLWNLYQAGTYRARLLNGGKERTGYFFTVCSSPDLRRAAALAREARNQGDVLFLRAGALHILPSETLDLTLYVVARGPFRSAKAAQRASEEADGGPVFPFPLKTAWGWIALYRDRERLALDTLPLRLVPRPGTRFRIRAVPLSLGFEESRVEDQVFGGTLELRAGPHGQILLLNEVPLELYVLGVLPYEMSPQFPLEALKAQAIAARSEALATLGRRIRFLGAPYDFSADVYAQVYGGLSRADSAVRAAQKATYGLVLTYNGAPVNAVYSAVCGGHTENSEDIWSDTLPYLRGVWDLVPTDTLWRKLDLSIESHARRFILSSPNAYCNLRGRPHPPYLNYAEKAFRWQVRYSLSELSRIFREKTGVNLGRIQALLPLRRGSGGRLLALEVVGSRGRHVLEGELTIRRALSQGTLRSSAFVAEIRGDSLVIHGAGYGHGVGMCQIGATRMALLGKRAEDILKHYYTGTTLQRLY